jgi:hypothetical protein
MYSTARTAKPAGEDNGQLEDATRGTHTSVVTR